MLIPKHSVRTEVLSTLDSNEIGGRTPPRLSSDFWDLGQKQSCHFVFGKMLVNLKIPLNRTGLGLSNAPSIIDNGALTTKFWC